MKVVKKIFIGILICGLILGSAFLFISKGSKSTSSSSSSTSSATEQSSSSGCSSSSNTEQNIDLVITQGNNLSDSFSNLSMYGFTQENYSLTVGNLDDSGSFISDNSHFVTSDFISRISYNYSFIFYTNGSYSNIITVYLYDSNKTLYDSYSLYSNNIYSSIYYFDTKINSYDETTGEVTSFVPSYMKFVITKDSSYNISFDSTGATAMADITQLYLSDFL